MLKNYLTIAIRNLMRSKVFSLINVIGLAFGLTCTMLIGSFVYDELNYDQYMPNARYIYRVGVQLAHDGGGVDDYPNVDVAVGAGMKNAFPEIVASTRLTRGFKETVHYKGVQFKEEHIVYADSNFLKIFGIPFLEGNADKALTDPNTLVITKAFEKKYFGDKSALGEFLTIGSNKAFKVTGVIEKVPDNSHFHFDIFVSTATVPYFGTGQTWSNIGFYTYLLLDEHADPRKLEAKFPALVEKFIVPEIQHDMGSTYAEAKKEMNSWKFYLMPVTDIHLHSATKYELEGNGDINYVYIFGVLAFFIVLLAGINFTNLSTANSVRRSKEVGIRKALGSLKDQLVLQFLVESVVLAMSAVTIATLFVFILLPFFNDLTGKHITILFFLSSGRLPVLLSSGLLIGLLAGIYPAFFLSSFQTIRVLKGSSPIAASNRGGLSSALVVFQFAISTALIIATIIVYQQLHYMQNMKLGYDKDQVLVIDGAGTLQQNEHAFEQKLLEDHRVIHASITSDAPVGDGLSYDGTEIIGKGSQSGVHSTVFHVDYDFLETMGIKIVAGRNLAREFPGDSSAVVINETAVHDLAWKMEDVLGKIIIRSGRREFTVVGVVADFHYASAKQKIAPLMLLLRNGKWPGPLIVKIKTTDIKGFLTDLKTQWASFNANAPLDYYFLDDRFERLYKSEQTTEKIFVAFVVIAIVIACLGLYGLSAFSAEQRVKEVGIRKVLGSTVQQVLFLLSKDFVILVLIAFVFAVPISWWGMHLWLQNFNYRIDIQIWVFGLAGLAAVSIAVITVSYQALRAAMVNPVKSLRSE
jgi:putative ABC transport system permease protein